MEPRKSWVQFELGERVVIIIRHHWFVMVKRFLSYVVLAIVPWVIGGVLYLINLDQLFDNPVEHSFLILGGSLYYFALIVFFFYHWADYYLDMWIITNHRVIDINQQGTFSRVISQYRLERIQDVVAEVSGLWPTVFGFGDVRIETAGTEQHFVMSAVARPREVAQKLYAWSHQRQEEIGGH